MKPPHAIVAGLLVPLLMANFVAPATEQQLFARSDVVVVGRVVKAGLSAPLPTPNRVIGEELVIGSIGMSPCVDVRVQRSIKGSTADTLRICTHRVSEMRTPRLKFGRSYRLFLTSAGAVYVPTSWDAIKAVP